MPDRLPEHADVLIVGAGPAGLAAAIELKRLGVGRVAVADREPEAGGIPRLCHHTGFGLRDLRRVLTGPVYAHHYRRRAQEAGVLVHPSTTITGWPGANKVSFTSPQGLGTIEARAILLATGCRERPRPARLVPGTRPQGIFTTGSLQRFVYEHHLPVGYRAVIVGAELVSLSALLTLHHAGVKTAAFLNELPEPQLYFPYNFAKTLFADLLYRTPIFPRVKVTNIIGRNRLEGVEVTHLDSDRIEQFECDTVVFTGDWIPEHELARLGGLMIDVGTRGPQVDAAFRTSARGVFAAGNLLRGAETADASALEGKSTATHIHRYLGDETWPERALSIQVEPPLTWVCPNALSALDVPPTHFRFRSAEFRDNVQLQVRQGNKVLHRQTFRRLIVNESMPLADKWLSKVDLAGEPLKFSISPISNF
jgi:NADPH-dependent 2,4-dienoyl-CoA reductase/sulfur reductase-like enzyme